MKIVHLVSAKKNLFYLFFLFYLTQTFIFADNINDKVTFSVQELENLGASTVQESLMVIKQLQKDQQTSNAQLVYDGDLVTAKEQGRIEDVLSSLSLDDIDRIEVDKEGNQIRYHLSKSLTKEGMTALFSFTLIDESNLPSKLDPVVTTATKFPIKRSEVGDIIRVIHSEEWEALGVTNIQGVLSMLANVSVSESSGVSSLFMRGLHSGATKVLYNGVDLKDVMGVNGAPLFDLIQLESVDRIEVMSGSNGVVHGSGSMAGIINIISDKDAGDGYLSTEISPDYYHTALSASIDFPFTSVSLVGVQRSDNSLSAKSDNDELDFVNEQSIKVGFNSNKIVNRNLFGEFSSFRQERELDDAYNDDLSYKGSFASFGYQHIWNAFISSEFSWNHSTIYRNYTKDAVDTLNYEGGFNNYELSNVLSFMDDYTMVIGIDVEREYGEASFFLKSKREKLGGYSQLIWNNPVLSFQLGGRVERNHHVNNNGDDTMIQDAKTYSLSAYRQIPWIEAMATYTLKTGFRVPTLYESTNALTIEGLKPEYSKTHEMTVTKLMGDFYLSTTYFNTVLSDKIDYDTSNWKYKNISQSTQAGFEYGVTVRDWYYFKFINFSHSNIDAKDNNSRALKVPDHKTVLSAGLGNSKFLWGLFFVHETDKLDIGDTTIADYFYLDLSLHYYYSSETSVYTKVHNVFNRSYERVAGFNELGRTVYVGFKKHF
tara:strand:- start:79 stop:2214 length:2136 start_codon:yes stop_codon:yes gene_type:complete